MTNLHPAGPLPAHQPPVVVVAPDLERDPSTFGDLTTKLADHPNYLPVRVRYGARRPRLADLAADILDGLGRVGTQAVIRRTQSADLTQLVPFLLTDSTDTLVVMDAGWLGVDGVEDLIAIAAVADHQLWLVLGETPSPELADLLREHCDPWLSLAEASRQWWARPPASKNAARLRKPVLSGRTSSDTARRTVVEVLAGLSGAHRRAVEDVYTRATVQPAITALHAVGLNDERFLRCLRVRELTTDGAELHLRDRTISVPAPLRRALVRQRLHAGVIGQRPGDQLLSFDGSVASPSALAWY
ncbi:hypothetical protein SAMN05660748_0693 [Blastococcus aggregatus]|uniref:Uncharacterized protein n=1 Tax=Blastococcus aggregatus TaxID=38502 RepID=A0A285UZX9_9ACTN|nr:hypothetical protein [Blastococcus aggregatus]SOC47217.1 hypothetical protein SAMN05660748_0693 [Blastococcus aggregatus]